MRKDTLSGPRISIGLDLGDRFSYVIGTSREGEIVLEDRVPTSRDALGEYFGSLEAGTRIVCEAGTHSPWVSALLEELELEVIVANPSQAGRALAANGRKNDRLDALTLATLGFDSVALLRPIKHRGREAQNDLAVLKARDCAVRLRTRAINTVRGLVKSRGHRLPSCSSPSFHRQVLEAVPEDLHEALLPLIAHVGELTALIRTYDRKIEELGEKYAETKLLRGIPGVGPLIALAFILVIDDPRRFERSRDLGAFLGLVPRQHESGERSPQLRISKAGNTYLRQLLVSAAHYILGPFGGDCELRRFGQRVGSRGGPKGKKRAVVAVARKLAVVMHRLWLTKKPYDPFYRRSQRERGKERKKQAPAA